MRVADRVGLENEPGGPAARKNDEVQTQSSREKISLLLLIRNCKENCSGGPDARQIFRRIPPAGGPHTLRARGNKSLHFTVVFQLLSILWNKNIILLCFSMFLHVLEQKHIFYCAFPMFLYVFATKTYILLCFSNFFICFCKKNIHFTALCQFFLILEGLRASGPRSVRPAGWRDPPEDPPESEKAGKAQ